MPFSSGFSYHPCFIQEDAEITRRFQLFPVPKGSVNNSLSKYVKHLSVFIVESEFLEAFIFMLIKTYNIPLLPTPASYKYLLTPELVSCIFLRRADTRRGTGIPVRLHFHGCVFPTEGSLPACQSNQQIKTNELFVLEGNRHSVQRINAPLISFHYLFHLTSPLQKRAHKLLQH